MTAQSGHWNHDFAYGDVAAAYALLIGAVAPRPIAWVSTISPTGDPNLAPFSYFNVFSADPPTLIFGVAREPNRTVKDTLANVREVPEVVIHIADDRLVYRLNLTAAPFPTNVDEFEKAGLSSSASRHVRPFRLLDAPIAFECTVDRLVPLGDNPGSATLVVCRPLVAHVANRLRGERGAIDPRKARFVGRLGGSWYTVATEQSLLRIPRANDPASVGWDGLSGDTFSLSEADQHELASRPPEA